MDKKYVQRNTIQILDKFHLCESIYAYSKYLHNNRKKEYVKWAEVIIQKISNGKINEVLEIIPKHEGKLPSGVPNLRVYIQNNIDKTDYANYKSKGYYIGSGAIESGNKTILQRRLKQAGMRWEQKVLSMC